MDRLGRFLEEVYRKYGSAEFIETDPLPLVRRYKRPEDREIAGFLTATLSYGRVGSIRRHVEEVLRAAGDSPSRFVRSFDPRRDGPSLYPLRYRFHVGREIAALFVALREIHHIDGGLQDLFVSFEGNTRARLEATVRRIRSVDLSEIDGGVDWERSPGLRFLLPSPEKGSACKRWNLFFRWMVRPDDGIDCGLWDSVSPSELVVPLDTHLHRIGRRLGLVVSRSTSWEAAERFTETLRRYDENDPLRFDFPLCRLGILDRCPESGFRSSCFECGLRDFCEKAAKAQAQKIR